MKDIKKDKQIVVRVTEPEKYLVEQYAKDNHFASVSAFIIWLVNKYGKKQE